MRWTEADVSRARQKIAGDIATPLIPRSKFQARPTWRGDIRFPSKLQATHYDELLLLQRSGHIRYFVREIPFDLPGNTKHRVDWMIVIADREPLYAESKGHDVPLGKLKRRQVEELYGVRILLWTKHAELS
jgi:hypothetical protein